MTQTNPSLVAVARDGSRQALPPSDRFVARVVHERVRIPGDGSSTLAVAECPRWRSCFDDADTASHDRR